MPGGIWNEIVDYLESAFAFRATVDNLRRRAHAAACQPKPERAPGEGWRREGFGQWGRGEAGGPLTPETARSANRSGARPEGRRDSVSGAEAKPEAH